MTETSEVLKALLLERPSRRDFGAIAAAVLHPPTLVSLKSAREHHAPEVANIAAELRAHFEIRLKQLLKRGPLGAEITIEVEAALALIQRAPTRPGTSVEDRTWLRLASYVSELSFYLGRRSDAELAVADGPVIAATLPVLVHEGASAEERALIGEKIRYCANWVQANLYGNRRFLQADRVLTKCERLVSDGGLRQTYGEAFHGTLAQLRRYHAHVFRKLSRFDDAHQAFVDSIQEQLKRAQQRARSRSHLLRGLSELMLGFHRTALCLLGIAWIDLMRGRLTNARQSIGVARELLILWNDELNVATADLLEGIVMRNMAEGKFDERLSTAIEKLDGAIGVFHRAKHPLLRRALYERAIAHTAAGDATKAFEDLKKVEATLEKTTGDENNSRVDRWQSFVWCRRSRIERECQSRRQEAEQSAREGLSYAEKSGLPYCQVDAWLQLAFAQLMAGGSDVEAQASIDSALAILATQRDRGYAHDTRIAILAHAMKSMCETRLGNAQEARHHLRIAVKGMGSNEHANLRTIVGEAGAEFRLLRRFEVTARSSLHYASLEKNLRQFLLKAARGRGLAGNALATELGVSRATVSQWTKELFPGGSLRRARHRTAAPTRKP